MLSLLRIKQVKTFFIHTKKCFIFRQKILLLVITPNQNFNRLTMIKRKPIESSILKSIGYDSESKILEIELKKNKQIRQYHNFPKDIWEEFRTTDSKGLYFLKYIKDKYDELRFATK